jgi:hypothetical protein
VELRRAMDESQLPFVPAKPTPANKEIIKSSLDRFYKTSKVITRKH